jgi:hypothetical protein
MRIVHMKKKGLPARRIKYSSLSEGRDDNREIGNLGKLKEAVTLNAAYSRKYLISGESMHKIGIFLIHSRVL